MKNLILFILVLLQNIVLFGQESISVDDSKFCAGLVKYRDEELLSDFLKVSDNYKINYQAKIDIEKIKNDLLDDNKWQMSAAGNAFGQLMSLTKSTCILILELIPASKSIKLELEGYKIYKLYTYGKKAKNFVTKDFEQFLFDEGVKKMLGDLNPVMTITQEILKTANNMDNLDKNWKDYKETVQNQIINLDKSIKNYDAAIIKYENDFERINKYKNFIDKYLSENCSNTSPTKPADKTSGVSAMNLNGKWKSDIDRNLKVTIVASNEDEFLYDWVVSALIRVKGKANFKRDSENIFSSKISNILNCYRAVITYISPDRLGLQIYKCTGAIEKTGELYRVGD
jgi:esterase/lipase